MKQYSNIAMSSMSAANISGKFRMRMCYCSIFHSCSTQWLMSVQTSTDLGFQISPVVNKWHTIAHAKNSSHLIWQDISVYVIYSTVTVSFMLVDMVCVNITFYGHTIF